ncbi:aminoglycoside phosphotransferase family protein [Fangia hongkongensis]|uniref:aminoglycoside phosphotransferase family protein n=1 Tax=Fangia hongkongensis TaxID=270495 RepID=UPI00036D4786|nr:aminoglycoside phosphotransferase family protein [Fangia hongkongensis]MBK2125506.1 aminoglycoside phosphotransferase family protein [Fangia hongkongensis]
MITLKLAKKLIATQFPEYSHLNITEVEVQGHDNRTYRIGDDMLIRMPTTEAYALKVPIEQALLPQLAKQLSVAISEPIKMGLPSDDYPYPFSIYKWLNGESANHLTLSYKALAHIASALANFLTELQAIINIKGPSPGQHNWWRGDHISVYDKGAKEQIASLRDIIDADHALDLWEKACATKWENTPVWIHGDFASGNILIKNNKLSGIIDFGGTALGDPACDLVIAWTFLKGNSRKIFQDAIALDNDTWLRAKAWALWKTTFELSQCQDKQSDAAVIQKNIIHDILTD